MSPTSSRIVFAHRRRRFALVASVVLLALYAVTGSSMFSHPYFGLTLDPAGRVASVDRDGPAEAAGLEPGDRIAHIGPTPTDRMFFLTDQFYSGSLGTAPILEVETGAGRDFVRLVSSPDPPPGKRWGETVALATGVGFLAIGLYVALNVEGWIAFVFFGLCAGFSVVLMPVAPPAPAWLVYAVGFVRTVLGALLLPPLILHFFLLFPRPSGFMRRRPALYKWIYAPFIAVFAYGVAYVTSAIPRGPVTPSVILSVLFLVSCVLALVSFIAGFVKVRYAADRRRYRVVFWATLLGMAPFAGGVLAHTLSDDPAVPWPALTQVSLLLIPLGFGYAILRHRIFDAEIIVKRSAVFSILTAIMVIITFGVYAIFGRVLEQFTGGRSPWVMLTSLLVIAGVFSPLRRWVEHFVDRTFFRDRYDERRALRELGQALPGILDLRGLLTEVVDKLSRTLRTREAAIFLREADPAGFRMAYASGLPVGELDLPPIPARLLKTVTRESRAVRSGDVEDRLPFGDQLDDEERLLSVFAGGVWVPMRAGVETMAVLALGPRAGGEAFRIEDLELLQAVAGQASVGIRNAILHEKEVEQERVRRDLEVARDMQQQLLPAADPIRPGLDVSGGMTACDEVGGDFYDYLNLPGERLAIAVGDVSGHGVPAAMHMASLSATLRAEAERDPTPTELLARLNARACETFEGGQFVTLFYATFTREGRTLTYGNAGHPPPLVVEPGGKVLQLTTGGLLLGIEPDAYYPTDALDIPPGSTICIYSDGLTEARRGEIEFGEDRLVDIVRRNPTGPASDLRARILNEWQNFHGEHADDDVTLIVVRVS